MFGWSRLSRVEGEESDVNLLSADELAIPTSPSDSNDHTGDRPLTDPVASDPPSGPPLGAPSPGTRDCSSSSRSRHRGRRHRHHGRQRLCRFKRKESNLLTAISCMFVVVLVCTSLAEPHWFYFSGGKCVDYRNQPINYLGVKVFFYPGNFQEVYNPVVSTNAYHYGSAADEVLINCVTPSVVFVMKTIISLCFLVIVFSLTAFILHLVGPPHRVLRSLRTNGIFTIMSVIVCIIINGLSYLVVEQLTTYFQENLYHEGSRVDVEFSLGFYMITAAGAMSIIGIACNLLRRPSDHYRERRELRQPVYDYAPSEPYPSACSQLEPPPYAP